MGAGCATEGGYDYNAVADRYEDLITAGVIDSDQGRAHRAQNATSVTSLTLTTEALIAVHREPQRRPGTRVIDGSSSMWPFACVCLRPRARSRCLHRKSATGTPRVSRRCPECTRDVCSHGGAR